MKKILLIEDDKWFADSIVSILKKDFEIRVCYDPENVFEILEKWSPDLLLADVMLGEKNLFVLLNEIQSYQDTRNLDVVILSSAATQIKRRDVAKYNVKKVLDKAEITPNDLRKTLNELRGKRSMDESDPTH